MKKNILAENMLRFGTKNLSETNLQDLENKLGFDSGANRDPRTGNLKTSNSEQNLQNKMAFLGDDDIDDMLDIIMTYTKDPDEAQAALDNFLENGDFGDSAIEANVTRDPRWKFGK